MTDFAIDFELIIHLCTLHTKHKKWVVIYLIYKKKHILTIIIFNDKIFSIHKYNILCIESW